MGEARKRAGFGRRVGAVDVRDPGRRLRWESVRYELVRLGILAPILIVLVGVVLDRAGLSGIGITLTFAGGVVFVLLLCVLARWG